MIGYGFGYFSFMNFEEKLLSWDVGQIYQITVRVALENKDFVARYFG